MLNLIPYEIDCKKYFKEISDAKTGNITISKQGENIEKKVKDILNDKQEIIIRRYDKYFNNKKTLENIDKKEYTDFEIKALKNCYKNPTKKLKELKRKILEEQKDTQKDVCQYCGINSFHTFDHYLPISLFPEYSVLSINLIPCCYKCNQAKNNNWKDSQDKRKFINLYYDELPNKSYLHFNITYEDDLPVFNFYLSKPEEYDENEVLLNFDIFKSHFINLSLIDRFERKINGYITEIRSSLKSHRVFTFENIKNFLEEEYEVKTKTFGINHWKSALLRGLMESEEFINDCIEN